MKKELLEQASRKLYHAICALEDVEIELDGIERIMVGVMIKKERTLIEHINLIIECTQEKV